MKSASEERRSELNAEFKKNPPASPELNISTHLLTVVDTFIQVQQKRNDADYDTSKEWTRTDVLTQVDACCRRFRELEAIREEPVAQAYLLSLLGRKRG
jgi:hypothetical protein